jgi:group I intron endonuclease
VVIYKITNLVNGKVYIGQTTKSIKERWKWHVAHKGCKFLNRAIRKYGKDNFKIEEIYTAFTKEELDASEKYFIKEFNTLVPNGYNICIGGAAPMQNRKHSVEAKSTISKKMLGIKKSIEHSKNIAESKMGNKNPMFGKIGFASKVSKSIVCINNNKIYGSARQAALELNLQPQNISKVLTGKRLTCGGYTFKFVEENHGDDK